MSPRSRPCDSRSRAGALVAAAIAVLALALPACATSESAYVDAAGRRSGRLIFERRCSECHALFAPASHSAAQWRAVLDDMAERAHLSPTDKALVLDHVLGRA